MLLDATAPMAKSVCVQKTAPSDFFWKYESAPSKNELEALIGAGENDPCNYETASGVVEYGYRYYNADSGRWLNRDPIEEQGGLNLYGMVGNDPINWIDLLGLDKLVYDGKKICRQSDDGSECKKCWAADSGKPTGVDENGDPVFDYSPERQKEKNTGPIPEGDYWLPSNQTTDPSQTGNWNTDDWNNYESSDGDGWKPWKTNVNPRGTGPWGDRFGRLEPDSSTNTHGRSHFNIHGGNQRGSAGCIDLGSCDVDFYDDVRRDGGGKKVRVTVDYSGNSTKDCDEPDPCRKDEQ